MADYNLTHTGADLDNAIGRALQGFAAADTATETALAAANSATSAATAANSAAETAGTNANMAYQAATTAQAATAETVQATETALSAAAVADQAAAGIYDALAAKADRQDTASVITGTATGEVALLPEAAVGSRLRALTISGKTIETGTGDKGPQNPYTLAGVQPEQLVVRGKNLLDLSGISIAGGCAYSLDGDILTVTKNTSDIGFWGVSLTVYLDVGSYFIKANSVSSDGAGVGISVVQNKDFVFNQATTSNPAGSFTVNAAGEFTVHFYASRPGPAGTTTTFTNVQLERGSVATDYEPYSGAVYPLPVTAPLYSLPDGTADTYGAAGEQVIRIGSMALTPDLMWTVMERANTTRFISPPLSAISQGGADNAVLCNHLPTVEVYNTDAVGICLHEERVVLSLPGSWDRDTFNNWLAVPPGITVTVYYPMAEPITTQLDGIAVTVPALDTYISAQGAPVTTEYNKDTMAVIAALTARIAALEGGGGA